MTSLLSITIFKANKPFESSKCVIAICDVERKKNQKRIIFFSGYLCVFQWISDVFVFIATNFTIKLRWSAWRRKNECVLSLHLPSDAKIVDHDSVSFTIQKFKHLIAIVMILMVVPRYDCRLEWSCVAVISVVRLNGCNYNNQNFKWLISILLKCTYNFIECTSPE